MSAANDRTDPIPTDRPGPAVWLYAAHGGAGVSTLEHYLPFTADSDKNWPCGTDVENESPFVVVVARETSDGLRDAHRLIMEHRDNRYPSRLLGLITIAYSPTLTKGVRQYRDVVGAPSSVPAHWSIGWHHFLPGAERRALPQWHPLDGIPDRPARGAAAVPADVLAAGVGMVTAIQRALPQLRGGGAQH